MSQQGNSIGRDITLVAILPDGTDLSLGDVTSFAPKQITTNDDLALLTGQVKRLRFYRGWQGQIKTYRTGSALDDYFAGLEADYYAGVTESPVTVQETISEPDGTISEFLYTGVLLSFDDPGEWASDKAVLQTVGFFSTTRTQVS